MRVEAHFKGWPAEENTLDDADTIVMISDGGDRNEWRDTANQTGESVYGSGRPAGSQSSFDTGTGSTSFNTGDRPGTGDVQGRGGL